MQDSLFECHHYLDKVPPEVEFHEHEFYEIYFFLSGAVSYVIEGRTYQLRPGDILLTNNEDIHRPETLAYLYLCEFLVYLNRAYFSLPDSIWQDVSENENVNQVIAYINDHLSEDLSLDRLANHFYVSKYYLSHRFKEYTGLTLYQFIIKKRLVVARNMLREGTPVTTVCLQCGFNDYSNFLKQFKREFGRSPKEFMRQD